MPKLLSILLFSFFLLNISAQDKYISCHHTKKHIRPQELTERQEEDLYRNIARSDTFDIMHYDIHLDVTDYEGEYLKAKTIIQYKAKMDDVTSITFDLRGLTIDSIKSGSNNLNYTRSGTDLYIDLIEPTVQGESAEISVWYQGQPYLDPQWGGFYFQANYIYNLGIGISTIPPNFGKVWYPCFDTYVERATYDYYVTSDAGWRAFCQGELIDEEVIGTDTIMRHFALDKQIPTYLSAVAVADYESYEYTHTGAYADIPIRLTSKTNHQAAMQSRFASLGSSIDALEYWFGPEYWGRVGYVLTVDGAMEHPTNIAYPQAMMGASEQSNINLFSHELGHHWWGDMVSQSSYSHMWLKEGPAEYSIHLVKEWTGGEDAYIDAIKDNHEDVLISAHFDDDGFYPLSPMPAAHIYGTHSYKKGASIMNSLRTYMGDSLFRQGTSFVLDSLLDGVLDPETFKSILTYNTGVDLEDFFDDWVYKPGFASFEINSASTVENVGQFTFTSTLEIEQKLRECPSYYHNVPIRITAVDASLEKQYADFYVDELSTVEFVTTFEPIMFIINEKNNLNLAKLDYEITLFEETNTVTLPYVDFKLKVESIDEESMIHIEHQWVAPDNDNLDANIDEISNTHYWIVNGTWTDNTELHARLNYKGVIDGYLDYDLMNGSEEGALLAYRESPTQMWIEYPYYTLFAGSLTNGNGAMRIDSLLRGEYAFAKGSPQVGIEDVILTEDMFNISPNPVKDYINIHATSENISRIDHVELRDMQGRIVKSCYDIYQSIAIDDEVGAGQYILTIFDAKSEPIYSHKIIVE